MEQIKDVEQLVQLLRKNNLRIASCESVTAGLFASMVTSIPHASQVLQGGIIAYQNEIKQKIVGVDKTIIERYGVISSQCVEVMATSIKNQFNAEIGVSFSGNAGPSAMENHPVGCVWIAIADENGVKSYQFHFAGERNDIRKQCVIEATHLIMKHINNLGKK